MTRPRFGLGFRTPHTSEALGAAHRVDWLEVVSDHHLGVGGPRRALLDRLRCEFPIALHGVGLDVAGCDPLDESYLAALAELVARCEPVHVSDHLCWTSLSGRQSHDLLPIAYSAEVLGHVAGRVARVQDRIGRRLLLENASAYVAFSASEMDEAEFLAELCRATGCGVLLDVNNLHVNAMNLGVDPGRALARLPESAVGYLHLAGHAVLPDVRIDTHAEPVPAEVWELFAAAARRYPRADVILERDDDLPGYETLVAEVELARTRHAAAIGTPGAPVAARRTLARATPHDPADWPALQRSFWQCVVAPPERGEEDALAAFLDPALPVRAERGMRVYRDGFRASRREALRTNFPSLARVLSARDWIDLCDAYFAAHPPAGHGFTRIGVALGDFLCRHRFAQDYGVDPIVFAELARLEQAQLEAQDAPDAERTLGAADLAALDPDAWERASVEFVPSLRLVRATHDVAPVVRAAARGEPLERPRQASVVYAVVRSGERVETIPLAAGDRALAEALFAGRRLADACAALREETGAREKPAAERAASWLVNAAARGWLLAIEDHRGVHDDATNGDDGAGVAGGDRARSRELYHQSATRA